MTIGIAAYGPNAGLAIFTGLRVAERIGRGCIGGFASLAALDAEGALHRAATQRGGSSTLFIDGDVVGAEPPPAIAGAPIAALMSSGPDRPEPLSQFVAADPRLGLVTGHRFANEHGANGVAFNEEVLKRMLGGMDVAAAVDAVIDAHPQRDVGLIGIDLGGQVHARDSARVLRRPDRGEALRERRTPRAIVAVLHNAIHPAAGLAAIVAETVIETMAPMHATDFWIDAIAGTKVIHGEHDVVQVDADRRTVEVCTTDRSLLDGHRDGAPIYTGAAVIQDGRCIGYVVSEPYVVIDDGRIRSLSGQPSLKIGCRRAE